MVLVYIMYLPSASKVMVHVSVDALSRSRPLVSAVLCQENVLLGLLKVPMLVTSTGNYYNTLFLD